MSVKIMSYVWDIPAFKGSDKLVMLCLADFANEDGFCWPSIETIARKSGVSISTVKAVLKKLASEQWLTKKNQFKKIDGKSVRASNQYLLHVARLRKFAYEAADYLSGAQSQQPDSEPSNGEQPDSERSEYTRLNSQNLARGRSESGYKPSIDPPIDPSNNNNALREDDLAGLESSRHVVVKPEAKQKKLPVPDLDFSVMGEITPEQIQMILRIRKSKRANVTQNVLNQLAKQFGLAARNNGLSLQECLDEWEYRGWQAFKAEWLSKPGNGVGLSLSELNDDTSWIDGMDLDELGFNGV
ncbi:helix-turn-helix domain-containing protein [Vibrio parahaemolyticus]